MSFVHALLLFVGGPIVVMALCYLLAVAMSRGDSKNRYELGDKWDREPLWYVGSPREGAVAHNPHAALESGNEHLPSATMVGGASGTW